MHIKINISYEESNPGFVIVEVNPICLICNNLSDENFLKRSKSKRGSTLVDYLFLAIGIGDCTRDLDEKKSACVEYSVNFTSERFATMYLTIETRHE